MKILVRAPNWLGDLVMSAGFFHKLAELYPDSEIDVIVKENLSELMPMFPRISRVFPFSKGKFRGVMGGRKFVNSILHKSFYDIFFTLPDSFSSAFMGYFTRSKERVGYEHEFRSLFLTRKYKKPKGIHRVEEYGYLLHEYTAGAMKNLTVKLNFPDSAKPSAFGTAETGLRIILNVNSQASSRRVPLFKAASIAKALIRHFNCLLVLTGTVKDKPYIDDLKSRIDCPEKILDLSGKTTLSSLAMIMKHVDMVVSTDSGPSHLANSLGTKLLILGGPADDSNTGPYEKYNYSIARAEGMSCAPCVKNVCPFGTSKCLLEIKEALIVEKAAALLGHSN